jgi:hypothetical protein
VNNSVCKKKKKKERKKERMTDLVGFINDILGVQLATIGTTNITLGLVAGWTLVIGVVMFLYRRVRGRG